MTRRSTGFRRLAWLALAAVLLIAVAPTVSRVLAATAWRSAPTLMQLCTTSGLRLLDLSTLGSAATTDDAATPMAPMDDACGYCVLVATLPFVLLLLCLLQLRATPSRASQPYSIALRSPRNTRGLGSQAPPAPL